MDFFSFVPSAAYRALFHSCIFLLAVATAFRYLKNEGSSILYSDVSSVPVFTIVLSIALAFFLGMRTLDACFGDTWMYAYEYDNIVSVNDFECFDLRREWFWADLESLFKTMGFSVRNYFLFVEFVYIGCMLIASCRLFHNSPWIGMLFFLTSFSFYGYAINGIRNGMACSLLILAFSLWNGNIMNKSLSIFIGFLAYGIHHSVILPFIAFLSSAFFIKDFRIALGFWIFSIFISLLGGNALADFLANYMGFDERFSHYLDSREYDYLFSHTGFRLDFLIYSFMPVVFAIYLLIKRNFKDKFYTMLINVYTISNAFWVIVIRASSSNRFAYLSWFLYPVVIAYPLFRMHIWEKQDRKTAYFLLAYAGFTYFMFLIGK